MSKVPLRNRLVDLFSGGELSRMNAEHGKAVGALREARDLLLERTRQDRGWINLLAQTNDNIPSVSLSRTDQILLARAAFEGNDPFVKSAVQSKTEFCFGNGIDGPAGEDPVVENVLKPFWDDEYNQEMFFNTLMQFTRSYQLLIDGELFITLSTRFDQTVEVNTVSSLNIVDIIYHPRRAGKPLYYKAIFPIQKFDAELGQWVQTGQEVFYYKDWQNEDPTFDPLAGVIPQEKLVYSDIPGDTLMMHVPINRCKATGFGISDVLSSLRWLNAAKNIAEDQATISSMTAAYMTLLGIEGGEDDVSAVMDEISNQIDTQNTAQATLMPPAGTMTATSTGAELKLDRVGSQAADAFQNNRMMRIAAFAGMRLPLHYGADPENANLATARTMELPTMKHFLAYQAIWVAIYRNLFSFQMSRKGVDPSQTKYDIPVPRMLEAEVRETSNAVLDGYGEGLLTREQAAMRMLQLLGFDDIYAELQNVLKEEPPEARSDRNSRNGNNEAFDNENQDMPEE